jgi:hypothetical protein
MRSVGQECTATHAHPEESLVVDGDEGGVVLSVVVVAGDFLKVDGLAGMETAFEIIFMTAPSSPRLARTLNGMLYWRMASLTRIMFH